jgi:hypothetical protein
MAKGKGGEGGYGEGDNVHSGSGSKGGAKGYSLPKGKTNRTSEASSISSNNGGGSDETFAKGGNTKMFSEQAAGEQEPGCTSHDVEGGAPGDKFAKGGSTKMFGYNPSQAAQAGITSAR